MHRINANNQYRRFGKIGHRGYIQNKRNFGFVQNKFNDRVLAGKREKKKQKEVKERIKEDQLLNGHISCGGNKQTTKKLITKFNKIFTERQREFQLKMWAWFMIFMLIGMILSSVNESTHAIINQYLIALFW